MLIERATQADSNRLCERANSAESTKITERDQVQTAPQQNPMELRP
jgi:hypothetical protein